MSFGFDHPNITFTKDDFKGIKLHKDDPIVVQLKVNSYDIRRVLLTKEVMMTSFTKTTLLSWYYRTVICCLI